MATSNQLNAGAASFTPSGLPSTQTQSAAQAAMQDSFTEGSFTETSEMESAEFSSFGPGVSQGAGVSGLPSHLARHANEFWFPESRDCTCCKGFKHGCQCATTFGDACRVCSTGPLPSPAMSLQSPSGGRATPVSHSSAGRGAGQSRRQVCKFFNSPGGCRFGDSCRFVHPSA